MLSRTPNSLLQLGSLLLWISSIAAVQAAEANQFFEPDGSLNDFSQKYTIGDTLNIQWVEGWFGFEDQPDSVDLWVTWYHSDNFEQRLISNTSVKQPGSFAWKIDVTEQTVREAASFVLRFRPHRDPEEFTHDGPMSPSRGFFINLPPSSSSSTSTISSSSTLLSSSIQSASSSPASNTEPASSSDSPSGNNKSNTNTGAITGGVVGGLALIISCIVAFLLLRVLRRRRAARSPTEIPAQKSIAPPDYPPKYTYGRVDMTEIDGRELPVEAAHWETAELSGYNLNPPR